MFKSLTNCTYKMHVVAYSHRVRRGLDCVLLTNKSIATTSRVRFKGLAISSTTLTKESFGDKRDGPCYDRSVVSRIVQKQGRRRTHNLATFNCSRAERDKRFASTVADWWRMSPERYLVTAHFEVPQPHAQFRTSKANCDRCCRFGSSPDNHLLVE